MNAANMIILKLYKEFCTITIFFQEKLSFTYCWPVIANVIVLFLKQVGHAALGLYRLLKEDKEKYEASTEEWEEFG